MARYALQRIGLTVPLFLAAAFLIFMAGRLAPGDPIVVRLGDQYDERAAQVIRRELGLDRPLLVQFAHYLTAAARFDFGESFARPGRRVGAFIADALPISLRLTSLAIGAAALVGLVVGILAAVNAGSAFDRLIQIGIVVLLSVPNFVIAAVLVLVFAVRLGVLPVAGLSDARGYVLPVVVLALLPTAYVMRIVRAAMMQALTEDFMRTAYSKGLARSRAVLHHALRNAALPIITQIGLSFGYALTGSFIVELIFNIPGMARVGVEAIFQRDYPVIQAVVLVYMAVFTLVNLLVDLSYAALDPRVRY
ncbi:MAG: ABC transporter permease [Armatimonadota bacterium]|nr:ABC transporter permease [Armatimonadota bacterium]MDR7534477.1 ABC transporter permease [Armatimonadota bacterium]MDR7535786.1 ABC transporter permease [Armatimonadota bacterium]